MAQARRRTNSHTPSRAARVLSATLAALLIASALVALSQGASAPVSGARAAAGITDDPEVLFREDFQNRISTTPIVALDRYMGASGMTFSASAPWLTGCNGIIGTARQPLTSASGAGPQVQACNGQLFWNRALQLTQALGQLENLPVPETNYAVTAFTSVNPGANFTEVQTAKPVLAPANGARFIAFSADVAAINCPPKASAPTFRFDLLDGGAPQAAGGVVDACQNLGRTVTAPALGSSSASTIRVGTVFSPGSVLTTSSSLGLRIVNTNGSGAGNDHAFDNLTILDATPRLDKFFTDDPADGPKVVGDTAELLFAVTNTSDLAAKEGWSFTDDLVGTEVAGTVTSNCPELTSTAPVGASTISVTGSLAENSLLCEIRVPVRITAAGELTNGPDNLQVRGLVPQSTATLETVAREPAVLTPDSAQTLPGAPVAVDVLANDAAGTYPLDPASVQLVGPGGSLVNSLTTPQGRFAIVGSTVAFTPAAGFSGPVPPVQYSVADTGPQPQRTTSTLTITVAPPMVARDDAVATPSNTPVTVNVLSNDTTAVGRTIDATSVKFTTTAQPAGAVVAPDGRSLTLPGVGAFTVNAATGAVRFVPNSGFSGPVPPVTYAAADSARTTDTAQLAVTVGPPPLAAPDTATTRAGTPTSPIGLLNNDAFDSSDPVNPASVVFPPGGQPSGAIVSPDGKRLTLPGVGVFTIANDGTAVFAPATGFSGPVAPVAYRLSTNGGLTASSTLAVDVLAPLVARDDVASTPAGVPVTTAVVDNDTADATTPVVASTVRFPTAGQPLGAIVSDGGSVLTVPGQGRYLVDTSSGSVNFEPAASFSGVATPVTYSVQDAGGSSDTATLTVTVGPLPVAADDSASTTQGEPVTVPILSNDGGSGRPALDAATVSFPAAGQPSGARVSSGGRELTVPGVGIYLVDPVSGAVRFTPAGFVGTTTPIVYRVLDVNGVAVDAQITIAVAGSGADTATDPTSATPPSATRDSLARTGVDARPGLAASAVLMLLGAVLVAVRRRRAH